MKGRQIRVGLTVACSIYLFVLFFRTFSAPREKVSTEHNSNRVNLIRELERSSNWSLYGFNFRPNYKPRLGEVSSVRQQLAFQFPYDSKRDFEKNIWQTWKVGIDDPDFPKKYRSFQESWGRVNEDHKYYLVSDDSCHELINQLFSTVPDVADAYNSMPKSILKADFFRYLILFARGGVYSDIDTVGLKPVSSWISNNETLYGKPNDSGLVVGIEADPDRPDWADWYARRIQFCQWTIQAKRGHPMLGELIARITDITLNRKKKNQLKKILGKDSGGDIMNWTGPGIFTDTVFEYMNNYFHSESEIKNEAAEKVISWKTFTGMQLPIAVGDVLVLPITSFSPDVGHMGSKSSTDVLAYVRHVFSGSWKPEGKAG